MQFTTLENTEQLKQIKEANNCQVVLKHNTTCPISRGVLERLQSQAEELESADAVYILDLLAHRDLSNALSGQYGIPHRSPQLLVIKNGRCVYNEWGFDISAPAIAEAMEKAQVG